MPRHFRLRTAQYLNEVADANLLIVHQIEESESCVVAKSLKEALDVVRLFHCHDRIVYALTYVIVVDKVV